MTYAGSRGKTAKEMRQVLGFGPLKSTVPKAFSATLGSMKAAKGQYTFASANVVFVDKGFCMRPSYRSLLANYYSAGFKTLDFHKTAKSAQYINKWAKYRTNGTITDIINPTNIKGSGLALVNVIYFKGRWKSPFSRGHTRKATFHISPSRTTQVNMMIQTARFKYSFNRRLDCKILKMPYSGDGIAMYILLPRKRYGLAALESQLTYRRIASALAHLRPHSRSVAIPRFEVTFDRNMPETLKAMGMKLAFEQMADFRSISRKQPLHVNEVIHKAVIGVDERGTEAAAATEVTLTYGYPPSLHKHFVADHPFLFLIRDCKTGSILFLGRFVRPPPLAPAVVR